MYGVSFRHRVNKNISKGGSSCQHGNGDQETGEAAIFHQLRGNGTATILNPKTQDPNPVFR